MLEMNQKNRSGDLSAASQLTEPEPLPLLTTKLHRPPVTPDLERRARLMERLQRNRHRPLTLISAPAGYGKTMLASMWLETADCPSAWISLDETDNDLRSFTSYLLAALDSAFPSLELKTRALLQAPVLPPAQMLARYLLSDVEKIRDRFILALDDVHLIQEQPVLDLLSELLHHPLPSMSLVLIGRRDPPLPIASLRARRQVTEIRARDLRFTSQETAALLGQVLSRDIDGATATEWTERTEGWVTGLLLMALSLRHRPETDDVNIGVPERSPYLQDYLFAELLVHLPPVRRNWLLLTSLLDRFCAPLCRAIGQPEAATDPASLAGIEFIRWLQEHNLFLVPLDDRSEWFRFHHLFQQLLQGVVHEHVEPEQIKAAHRRASRWFSAKGLIEEALQHALAGGDVRVAVQLVEQHRYHLMNTEKWHRLERWLKLLPADAVAQSPLLTNTRAFLGFFSGQDREMAIGPQEAKRLVATQSPETATVQLVQAETAVVQAVLDIIAGQPEGAVTRAQRSLELLPAQALYIRSVAVAIVGVGLQMQGEFKQGVAVIRETFADPSWPAAIRARNGLYLCVAHFQEGDLPGVLRSASKYLVLAEQFQLAESRSQCRYNLGIGHYLRNELSQAEPYLLALLDDRAESASSYVTVGAFALALLYYAQNRVSEAEQVIDLVRAYVETLQDTFAWAITRAIAIELALRRGKLAEAHRLSPSVDFDLRPPYWLFYVPQLTRIKLLLAEGTGQSLKEARARLEAMDEKMHQIHRNNVRIEVLALLALVHHALGDEAAAVETLSAALSLGKRGGFIRTFVDLGGPMASLLSRLPHTGKTERSDTSLYVDRILAAFGPRTDREQPPTTRSTMGSSSHVVPTEAHGLIEPLTEREHEVLALLAQRLTYKEIGAQLFIAPGTVSQHAVRIYAKLQVNSRHQAVVKAQALGILPQR
jgi:LuxR family maltose regulon positive regulatory protein